MHNATRTHTHTHSHKGHYFTTVLQHKQRVEFSWWRQEVAVNSCWQFWSLLNINTSHAFNSVLLERASPKKKWKSCILHFGNVILFHFRSNDDDCWSHPEWGKARNGRVIKKKILLLFCFSLNSIFTWLSGYEPLHSCYSPNKQTKAGQRPLTCPVIIHWVTQYGVYN